MDRDVYERMEWLETKHWWFLARRQIIETIISRCVRPNGQIRLLEAGCGTGGNLAMLAKFGSIDAFEFDPLARAAASKQIGREIPFGALPNEIPFGSGQFDLIGLFDVLEHIEDDIASLAALRNTLKPQGVIVVTVPAFPLMWSRHDETHHHFRRYTKRSLKSVAADAGLRVENSFYFNSTLFPLALAMRALKSVIGNETPDDAMPSHVVNETLRRIFAFERHLIGRISLPVGLSLGAVLRA